MSAHTLVEIQQLIEAALARHGTAGDVHVDEKSASLLGNGRSARVEIDHLIAKWSTLPFPERHRECGLIARALAKQRRSVAPRPRGEGSRPMSIIGVAALALLSGGGVYAFGLRDEAKPDAAALHDALTAELASAERERQARAERVCNATRTRISRGGTVGPTDAEGWVVELALLWSAAQTPAQNLADFIAPHGENGARMVWAGAPDLAKLQGPSTSIEVSRRVLPEDGAPQYRELLVTLSGEYVLPYFREPERIKLIRFSHAIAERHSAMLGALYARCATGTSHHMGSWFLGNSPGAAAAAVLYYMGAYAQPPLLPAELLSTRQEVPLEPAFALDTLLDRTRRVQRQDLASGVGALDGMVAGPATFTTLGFPFVDSDRALRASFQLLRLVAPPRAAPR